ncbi:iron-containing redox enzyme family protein [Herbiconiux ginsengi]|uniref:Iron-containing redox enzyme n=1 Tax=Herbiconiux ginsengi TaxID=381665 RepID=A0A1H3Q0C4_9MICO|nr:iron-containing redox enzyme family protein [Herbiconiux ginsengi]SDZ06700.1 Iron-containing redox enzyme [Herbiconiux ginsengi]
MHLPPSRGAVSAALASCLLHGDEPDALNDLVEAALVLVDDLIADDDIQISLFMLYELHYGGFDDVDDALEWNPDLLRARARIEARLEEQLRSAVSVTEHPLPTVDAVAGALFRMTAPTAGPGFSRHVAKKADEQQLRELLLHRSIYQLKEADPHTWAIPRLRGVPKAALVEVQCDEYGNGRPELMHSALFAQTMRGLGLNDDYGHYVDQLPAVTLASLNTMSMFGLHRRLRGAIAGHLAAIEMTSSIPNRLYGDGFRRLGHDSATTLYFDEHVEADAVHEQIAGRDLAGALAAASPELLDDILFGAASCLLLDELTAQHLLSAWRNGESSLRQAERSRGTTRTRAPGHYHG